MKLLKVILTFILIVIVLFTLYVLLFGSFSFKFTHDSESSTNLIDTITLALKFQSL